MPSTHLYYTLPMIRPVAAYLPVLARLVRATPNLGINSRHPLQHASSHRSRAQPEPHRQAPDPGIDSAVGGGGSPVRRPAAICFPGDVRRPSVNQSAVAYGPRWADSARGM